MQPIERFDRRGHILPRLSHDAMRSIMTRADRDDVRALLACYGHGDLNLSGGWSPELVTGLEDAIDHAFVHADAERDSLIADTLRDRASVSGTASTVLSRLGVPTLQLRAATVMAGGTFPLHTRTDALSAFEVREMLQIKVTLKGAIFTSTPEATVLTVSTPMPQTIRTAIMGLPMETIIDHPLLHGLDLSVIDVADFGSDVAIRMGCPDCHHNR